MAINKQRAYFSKFPLTQYKGKSAIDILKRVGVSTSVKNYLSAFYTHTMQRDETVDELAFNYYEDVNYDLEKLFIIEIIIILMTQFYLQADMMHYHLYSVLVKMKTRIRSVILKSIGHHSYHQ